MLRSMVTCVLISIVSFASAAAQEVGAPQPATSSLLRRHRIELALGMLTDVASTSEFSAGGVTTTTDAHGLVGGVAYTYYFTRDFGFVWSAGVFDADAKVSAGASGTSVESAAVMPVLFGMKFQPQKLALGTRARPYASAAIGPYIGSATDVQSGLTNSTEAYTEVAMGARLAIGVDFLLGRVLTLGFGGGYHLVSDFDRRVGAERNYSGPELSLTFGAAFGG